MIAPTLAELLRDGAKCDRSGSLWQEMLVFHRENPWVYTRLTEICFELRRRGFQRYSTRTLIAVLRFEWDMQTSGQVVPIGGEERAVKLNDHHTAYYARMLIEQHRDFWEFFELRHADGDPTELPPPPDLGPPQREMFDIRSARHG